MINFVQIVINRILERQLLFSNVSIDQTFFNSDQFEYFQRDMERYNIESEDGLMCNIPALSILFYRIARFNYLNNNEGCASKFGAIGRFVGGMDIYYTANIGPGLKINHGNALVIGANCTIGANATIYQKVTVGDSNPLSSAKKARPIIGDNVVIFNNATIVGPITVGNNAVIGANVYLDNSVDEGVTIAL